MHTAPTFGADDARVAKDAGVPAMLVDDGHGHGVPLVDLQGRFRVGPFAGRHVKAEFDTDAPEDAKPLDVEIAILLKERGQAFKVEKYEHSYPHCWRTDKPILYYPLDSWFIRATAAKERMIELNNTITWKPESTGTGRFGKWLENVNDWNLSRSRFWGIPLPIWRTEDGDEERCIGSIDELKSACDDAVNAGVMEVNPFAEFTAGDMSDANYDAVDLHKHVVDAVTLVSSDGRPMRRETDLIDVWFDSGSMPYAQWHYPFENKEKVEAGTPTRRISSRKASTKPVVGSTPFTRFRRWCLTRWRTSAWCPTVWSWTRMAKKCPSASATPLTPLRHSPNMVQTPRVGT